MIFKSVSVVALAFVSLLNTPNLPSHHSCFGVGAAWLCVGGGQPLETVKVTSDHTCNCVVGGENLSTWSNRSSTSTVVVQARGWSVSFIIGATLTLEGLGALLTYRFCTRQKERIILALTDDLPGRNENRRELPERSIIVERAHSALAKAGVEVLASNARPRHHP